MTFITTALGVVTDLWAFAAEDGEQFDPSKVTPGPEGFIATAVFAAAVLTLGFLLVRRIRRGQYREEVRESIAAELAERDGGSADRGTGDSTAGESGAGQSGADERATDEPGESGPDGR